jgi:outer membrane protein
MLLVRGVAYALSATILTFVTAPARAETVNSALVKAYRNNPQLNAERANVTATDEGVARAQAGYRPKLTSSGTRPRRSFSPAER